MRGTQHRVGGLASIQHGFRHGGGWWQAERAQDRRARARGRAADREFLWALCGDKVLLRGLPIHQRRADNLQTAKASQEGGAKNQQRFRTRTPRRSHLRGLNCPCRRALSPAAVAASLAQTQVRRARLFSAASVPSVRLWRKLARAWAG